MSYSYRQVIFVDEGAICEDDIARLEALGAIVILKRKGSAVIEFEVMTNEGEKENV